LLECASFSSVDATPRDAVYRTPHSLAKQNWAQEQTIQQRYPPMRKSISLFVLLFTVWLVLSGYFEALLLILGLVSCAFVVWIAKRQDVVDHEAHPVNLRPIRWILYTFWLVGEIVKSNIDVAKRVWDPKLPISPTIVKVPADPDELRQVIYANSITLTPGTVSIDLTDATITVHSLTREGALALEQGEMARRVRGVRRE
jgi:multicomponent Na+:H+ antiporter subunit E